MRVVDPLRTPLAERHEAELLAKPGHEVEPRLDVGPELVVRRRGPLEQGRRRDVHVCGALLEVQERGVEAAEPIRAHCTDLLRSRWYVSGVTMCDALRLRWHVERHHGSSIGVRVIDGGPFSRGREFDLTAATKQALGFPDVGTVLSSR
jgi:hypothetical protein